MSHDNDPDIEVWEGEEPETNDPGSDEPREVIAEQDSQAVEFARTFLLKVLRLRGVKIERSEFLARELRKLKLGDAAIAEAIRMTPVQAGVDIAQLDGLAQATIGFETKKSAAVSFAAGLPGGVAIAAAVPGDMMQYYVHAFRVMQKLAYIYGWQDFLGDVEEVDDETLGKMTLFLGVMLGVGGAGASLTTFAQQVARPALQKQISKQALTKTSWYPVVKRTLKLVGVKVTKDSFAKGVTKVVPVAGGLMSGGMTFLSLKGQSEQLRKHLRELPPPGVDAAQYEAAVRAYDEQHPHDNQFEAARTVTSEVLTEVKDRTEALADGARNAASGAASVAKSVFDRSLFRRTGE